MAQVREKLRLRIAAVQLPIGLEAAHAGVVDLVAMRALTFEGPRGDNVIEGAVPEALLPEARARRRELVESVADVDEALGEKFLALEVVEGGGSE